MHHWYGRISTGSVESIIVCVTLCKWCLPFSFKVNRINEHHNSICRKFIHDGWDHLICMFIYPVVYILHTLIGMIRKIGFIYLTMVIGLGRKQKIIWDISRPVFSGGHPDGICSIYICLLGPVFVQIALHFRIPGWKIFDAKCWFQFRFRFAPGTLIEHGQCTGNTVRGIKTVAVFWKCIIQVKCKIVDTVFKFLIGIDGRRFCSDCDVTSEFFWC